MSSGKRISESESAPDPKKARVCAQCQKPGHNRATCHLIHADGAAGGGGGPKVHSPPQIIQRAAAKAMSPHSKTGRRGSTSTQADRMWQAGFLAASERG
jgi:hypothetical protein